MNEIEQNNTKKINFLENKILKLEEKLKIKTETIVEILINAMTLATVNQGYILDNNRTGYKEKHALENFDRFKEVLKPKLLEILK
jgi:hypothetical protein